MSRTIGAARLTNTWVIKLSRTGRLPSRPSIAVVKIIIKCKTSPVAEASNCTELPQEQTGDWSLIY